MNNKISLPQLWPVTCHTDYVGKNSTFVAIKGQKHDGINYVPLALQKGARTIVAEHTADISPEIIAAIKDADAQLIFVANARRSLALLSANAWGNPSESLKIIAVTGTKGKTTTSWLLYHLLKNAGHKTALLSTVKNIIHDQEFATELTTQHPDYLHAFFNTCKNAKVEYVVMEVAAQAVSLNRVAGLAFDGLIFTNFAPAHGEFYDSQEEYYAAKKELFNMCKPGVPLLINADDQKGAQLVAEFVAAQSFAFVQKDATVTANLTHSNWAGLKGVLSAMPNVFEFECPALIGDFNGYNILAAAGMALALGISADHVHSGLRSFKGIPGRLEKYMLANGAISFIDYAHNPLSFRSVLPLLRSLTDHLIVVSGAGGDRDKEMRPVMGQLMSEYADQIFITTDNPRSENPADIIASIYAGVLPEKKHTVVCELDRQTAIQKAYACSRSGTIVALLGKGPDEYQIVGTLKIPFSERAILQQLSNV